MRCILGTFSAAGDAACTDCPAGRCVNRLIRNFIRKRGREREIEGKKEKERDINIAYYHLYFLAQVGLNNSCLHSLDCSQLFEHN